MSKLLSIASALVLLASMGSAQKSEKKATKGGSVESQIMAMEDESLEAQKKKDPSWAEKNNADDFHSISAVSGMTDKQQGIEMVKSGKMQYDSIDLSDRSVNLLAPTVAVSHATAKLTGSYDGKPVSGTFHSTRIWVKRGGRWKQVMFQSTKES
ncbi:MAG: hypothetical protein NVS9B15_12420 [Acidobacteriaceae bacterium]